MGTDKISTDNGTDKTTDNKFASKQAPVGRWHHEVKIVELCTARGSTDPSQYTVLLEWEDGRQTSISYQLAKVYCPVRLCEYFGDHLEFRYI
ncbi:Nn.00g024340.m01.CDS01 [Neocucurbitaria sp. VM-36]